MLISSSAINEYFIELNEYKNINIPITAFIKHWNILGALQGPSGSMVYKNNPYVIRNALFSQSLGASLIWWYPLAKWMTLKCFAHDNLSNKPSIHGSR